MNKKYIVRLTQEERSQLTAVISKGITQAYRIRHAGILLKIDANGPNWRDEDAAKAMECSPTTVRNVRQRFVQQGIEAALERKAQQAPSRQRLLDGAAEARLIAESCSSAPEGRARWTLRMLADRLVELEVVESISHETMRRTLKKTN